MGDPISLEGIFFGTMAGAGVVLFGALYALFFALGRLHESRPAALVGLLSYGALCVCCAVLAWALELAGLWQVLIGVMLVGYFAAPRAIWRLCVATHAADGTPIRTRG